MAISAEELQQVRQFMHDYSGIDLLPGKAYLVESRLAPLLAQNGLQSFTQLCDKLAQADKGLSLQVVDALTTHETLWFRDDSFFEALAEEILPRLVAKARRQQKVRIWSAATATGQEAYSVAMLLDHVGRKQDPSFDFKSFVILGTDISPASLAIARQGQYNRLAMARGMRSLFLERYFTQQGELYTVIPAIRQAVQFRPHNLKMGMVGCEPFDLILCRNVLIYFTDALKQQICSQMCAALASPDGYFAIGSAESLRDMRTGLVPVPVGRAVLYRAAR
ncbi:MAG: protein-glutamate O-methyltransferase CheR [Magnetococcus sp. MYC-9]